jgi:hypothetical protein
MKVLRTYLEELRSGIKGSVDDKFGGKSLA